MQDQVASDTNIMTDQHRAYRPVSKTFLWHSTVNHAKGEYVRGNVHTNTVENYFSVFKRGLTGTYQHMSEPHLKRYLAEFDFRYSNRSGVGINDLERADLALLGVSGKRLTYRTTGGQLNPI